jgi:hypothetical protein
MMLLEIMELALNSEFNSVRDCWYGLWRKCCQFKGTTKLVDTANQIA